jgi:hypothetical protein
MVDPRWAPSPIARWEWALLAVLVLACLSYWIAHYHGFLLPSSDYDSFKNTARELWSGELPSSYKRMPLFPFLMGLLAQFLTADDPHLHAALSLNIGFSLGILVVAFLLGRRLIGPAALLPTMAMLVVSNFHTSALQPLVDPSLTFLILLSLLLFARESRWQYLAAGLAALSRYEASGLIAIFFVLNFYRERRFWRHLLPAGFASLGFLAWMGLSFASHSGGNPYLSQIADQEFSLAWSMAGTMLRPFYHDDAFDRIALLVLVVGFVTSLRRFPIPSLAVSVFGLLYLAAHIGFGVDKSVYAHPVLWIPPFYMTVAFLPPIEWLARSSWRVPWPVAVVGLLLAAFLVGKPWGWELRNLLGQANGYLPTGVYLGFLLLLWGILFALGVLMAGRRTLATLALACILATGFQAIGFESFRKHVKRTRDNYYNKYQYVVGTRWLDEHLQPDEKALVFGSTALPIASRLSEEQLLRFGEMRAETLEELVPELCEKDVDYVVYWYRRGEPKDPSATNYARNLYFYRRYKVYLAEPFQAGEDVPGFEHLETLPLPDFIDKPPVQIYRFLGNAPGLDGPCD